ncbi:GDSL-type esterase/lipase family protein [Methylobacterium sp. NPDC080182]|uniref:GDSL-type esterase/lipase family protein n=1 Tax=Methylobacterium sp. NPDC080182 TaxID=3390590 RepID=UPI003D04DFFD
MALVYLLPTGSTATTLGGGDNGSFSIDSGTGVISRAGTLTAGTTYNVAYLVYDTATGLISGRKDTISVTAAVNATTGVLGDGDSIMRGYGLPSPTTQNMLAQFSSISGLPIFNSGSDGDTLANINSSWGSSGNAGRYSAGSLNTYLLEGGGADLRAGTSDATCRTNCQGIIAQAKAAGFICFVSTVLPQGTASAGWTSAADAQRVSYNTWLKANYASFADGIVDLAGVPEATDPNSTTYYQDGIHPTAALATILGQAIATAVTGAAPAPQSLSLAATEAIDTAAINAAGLIAQAMSLAATERVDTAAVSASVASAGGATTVQWNAADKDPSVTKTSATRVDRASTAGSTNGTIRCDTSKSSGRRYVEWKVEATSSNNQGLLVGFALGTEPVSNYLGQTNKSVGMWSNGSSVLYNAGPNNTGLGNFAVGDILSADLNIDAGTVRFAKNSAWGSVVNVAAMTTAGPIFVGATMLNVSPLTGTTANFGDSAFVYTPPSGAVAWNA